MPVWSNSTLIFLRVVIAVLLGMGLDPLSQNIQCEVSKAVFAIPSADIGMYAR